jgi:hypothetical protein
MSRILSKTRKMAVINSQERKQVNANLLTKINFQLALELASRKKYHLGNDNL